MKRPTLRCQRPSLQDADLGLHEDEGSTLLDAKTSPRMSEPQCVSMPCFQKLPIGRKICPRLGTPVADVTLAPYLASYFFF